MPSSHAFQVWRLKLAVYDAPQRFKSTCKEDESKFGCTWNKAEHTFPEEVIADVYAVETSNEIVIPIPHFHGCCKMEPMHLLVCLYHVRSEPCPFHVKTSVSLAAVLYNLIKVPVDAHAVCTFIHQLTHGMADMNFPREDYETIKRTEPQYVVPLLEAIPGEETDAVGIGKSFRRKVTPYCNQSVFLTIVGIGKQCRIISQAPNHLPIL